MERRDEGMEGRASMSGQGLFGRVRWLMTHADDGVVPLFHSCRVGLYWMADSEKERHW